MTSPGTTTRSAPADAVEFAAAEKHVADLTTRVDDRSTHALAGAPG